MRLQSYSRVVARLLLLALLSGLLPGAAQSASPPGAQVASSHFTPAGPAAPAIQAPEQAAASATLPAQRQPGRTLGPFPLAFVGNAGQSDKAVRYLVRSRGGTLFFNASEAVLAVPIIDPNTPVVERGRQHGPPTRLGGASVVRLRYDGANAQSELRPGVPLPGVVNYLTGSDPRAWLTNLPTYESLSYVQLYPGIDLRYDGLDSQLKRTYLVAAGADPAQIRWRYQGASDVRLDPATGDLAITLPAPAQRLPGASLRERAPIAWQDIDGRRTPVDIRYVVEANGSIGFALGAYDPAQPLTLDPVLSYSTFLGGSGNDAGNAITVDASGNAYVTGGTVSSNFPTAGPLQGSRAGSEDIFISKVSADGSTLLYSTFLGGSGEDEGSAIALDSSGNIVVAGETQSSNFPTQNALDSTFGGGTCSGDPCEDAIVAKLNAAGNALLYSTYLGGSNNDQSLGVAVDSSGSIYTTGYILSTSGLTMLNAYDSSQNGDSDAFIVKLDPSLSGSNSLLYSSYLGGGDEDLGNGIAVGSSGIAYIVGETESRSTTPFPTLNAWQSTKGSGSSSDAFLTKLDTTQSGSASLLYSTYLGGSSTDKGLAMVLNAASGYVYLTGYTQSSNFPTLTPLQASRAGDKDAFVTALNPTASGSASLLYSSYLGGTLEDRGLGIARDSSGMLYVAGLTTSTNFPLGSALQGSLGGGTDAFVTQVDLAQNSLGWSTYLGGSSDDEGDAIAVDTSGAASIAGMTESSNFPTTGGTQQGTFGGGSRDAFVVRIGPSVAPSNQPPTVNAGPNQAITLPTSSATLSGSALDDGLPSATLVYTWTKVSGPGTVTFGNSHALNTTASFSAAGVYVLRLSASDGVFTRSDDVLIAIMGANQAPVVNAGPDQTIASTSVSLPLAGAVRDDGLPLNQVVSLAWSQVSGPGTATFGTPAQALTTVRFSANGTYVLSLSATDTALSGSDTLTIVVQTPSATATPSATPTATPVAPTVLISDTTQGYYNDALGTSLNGTQAQFPASGDPTINPASEPDLSSVATVLGSWLAANPLPLNGNWSAVTTIPSSWTGGTETAIVYPVDAGANGITNLRGNFGVDNGIFVWVNGVYKFGALSGGPAVVDEYADIDLGSLPPGQNYIQILREDHGAPTGYTVRITGVVLTPTGPTPTPSPTATPGPTPPPGSTPTPPPGPALAVPGWIKSPLNRSTVSGLVPIVLTDTITLSSGSLDYWPADNPAAATTLAASVSGSGGATLATLDTTTLANGSYVIRLTGQASDGTTQASGVMITVVGENKPGRVRFEVTDLTVPLAGLPITVGRIYDSLERSRSGDFGYGWSLSIGSPRLTIDPANNVTVTQPNGQRVMFYFTPASYGGVFGFLQEPTYTPEAGVYGSLTANGCPMLVSVGGQFWCFLDTAAYQPTTYTYTDPYGRVFVMGASGKLQSITDLNQNTLTFGPTGITSSAGGRSVAFGRDGQGRITTITDPASKSYTYVYSSTGDLGSVTFPDLTESLVHLYDSDHLLLQIIDPRGNATAVNTYYADGRLKSITDAIGNTIDYTYDLVQHTTTITNPDGGTMSVAFDDYGKVVHEIDPLGRVTLSGYDSNHNLITHTNALSQTTIYTYDQHGNRTSLTDPLGAQLTSTYNRYGGMLSFTDQLGNVISVNEDAHFLPVVISDQLGVFGSQTWDSRGNTLTRTDANGRTTSYTYDMYGNVLTESDPLGRSTQFTYDQLGRKLTKTDAANYTTTYTYDSLGYPIAITDPLSQTTQYEYDTNGNQTALIDAAGRRTTYTYDAANRLIQTAYPDFITTTTTYDFRGNPLAETDRAGRVTQYSYDLAGQLLQLTIADGTADAQTTHYSYDAVGNKISEIDPLGNTSRYSYDSAGRLINTTDALSNTISYEYDQAGRLTAFVDANNHRTETEYDDRGRPIRSTYADGTTSQRFYSASGQLVGALDQANSLTIYSYDATDQLLSVTDALSSTTSYTYDVVGNLTGLTDANGNVTGFEYDPLGRLDRKIWPDTSFESYEYDAVGNQVAHQLADGQINEFEYDTMDQLTSTIYFDNQRVDYTYTPTGLRETATDSRGVTSYTYDHVDRLTSITTPYSQTIAYTYDAAGNRLSMTNPISTTNYEYDADNRLERVIDAQGKITTYTYDADGMRTGMVLPNGIAIDYAYDQLHRLTSIVQRQGSQVLQSYEYTFDTAGNRTSVVEADGSSIQWDYDAGYRLIEELWSTSGNTATLQIDYMYDAVGNRLQKSIGGQTITYTYNNLDQLLTAGATEYTYDERGNLTQIDDASAVTQFEYDSADRLAEITLPDTTVAQYGYDADGRRVRQASGSQITTYLWDEASVFGNVAMETDGGGSVQASYLLAEGGVLAQWRDGETNYYLPDGQGSVRALADSTGAISDRYSYDAFGVQQSQDGTTTNSYQYTGQQYDELTGLYNLRARYYHPELGRFLSRDRAAYDIHNPIEVNRYGYVHANPINYSDPSGLTAIPMPLPGRTYLPPAPQAPPAERARPGGGALAEYAGLIAMFALGMAAGATDIGRATHCMYLRATSIFLALVKNGPVLFALSSFRPERETCVIPVFIWAGNAVAYHIHVAQFERGATMLKTLDRDDKGVVNTRRTLATAPCPKPRPPAAAWGSEPSECDEYPYASTVEGGAGASVMLVPETDNSSHGGTLVNFYEGRWSNRWRKRLDDGTFFATVILFWMPPPNPSLIAP